MVELQRRLRRVRRVLTCISQSIHSVLNGIISFNIVCSSSSTVSSEQTQLEENWRFLNFLSKLTRLDIPGPGRGWRTFYWRPFPTILSERCWRECCQSGCLGTTGQSLTKLVLQQHCTLIGQYLITSHHSVL